AGEFRQRQNAESFLDSPAGRSNRNADAKTKRDIGFYQLNGAQLNGWRPPQFHFPQTSLEMFRNYLVWRQRNQTWKIRIQIKNRSEIFEWRSLGNEEYE